jgi:hypothetical protein
MSRATSYWPQQLPHLLWKHQCPLCTSLDFEAAEIGGGDFLMKLFHATPVRCSNCWRRYYWFKSASSKAA